MDLTQIDRILRAARQGVYNSDDIPVLVATVEAALRDLEDAKHTCGGDGLGCPASDPYYEHGERRYRKCGHCPMETLSNIREALDGPEDQS